MDIIELRRLELELLTAAKRYTDDLERDPSVWADATALRRAAKAYGLFLREYEEQLRR